MIANVLSLKSNGENRKIDVLSFQGKSGSFIDFLVISCFLGTTGILRPC